MTPFQDDDGRSVLGDGLRRPVRARGPARGAKPRSAARARARAGSARAIACMLLRWCLKCRDLSSTQLSNRFLCSRSRSWRRPLCCERHAVEREPHLNRRRDRAPSRDRPRSVTPTQHLVASSKRGPVCFKNRARNGVGQRDPPSFFPQVQVDTPRPTAPERSSSSENDRRVHESIRQVHKALATSRSGKTANTQAVRRRSLHDLGRSLGGSNLHLPLARDRYLQELNKENPRYHRVLSPCPI